MRRLDTCSIFVVSALLHAIIVMQNLILQIMKILKHQSVRGLSVISFELEVVGYTIALAYCVHKGLPFSAYGELAFLLIQGILGNTRKLMPPRHFLEKKKKSPS